MGIVLHLYEVLHPTVSEVPVAIGQLQEPREVILYADLCVCLLLALRHARAIASAQV